jgi:hypothetical protein
MKTLLQSGVLLSALAGIFCMPAGASAIVTTTGFTFNVPSGFPLHNVYMLTNGNGLMAPTTAVTSSTGSLGGGAYITPAGFSVPIGASAFNLAPFPSTGAFNPSPTSWAVVGVYTDGSDVDHLVLGTNANLTGVDGPSLLPSDAGTNESIIISQLEAGLTGAGEGEGLVTNMAPDLQSEGYMLPFGQTAQLFFFSGGAAIPGATVTANAVGVPITPEPASLSVLALGAAALLGRRRSAPR